MPLNKENKPDEQIVKTNERFYIKRLFWNFFIKLVKNYELLKYTMT